jgi:general stress protein CsbA
MSFSLTFWIVTLVLVMFVTGILTAAYNEDKTKGL